ncbi:hypothetical protein [Candidatus Clostridium radicumherbarum]|uniref:Uncharacterized protein n=1 Tax=Candidatus Clostridium radicumherbarum TaxID=3381662 RepID=A0ABW8U2V0_9CLOT
MFNKVIEMEIWDLLDKNGDKIGQTITKTMQLPDGYYHLGVDVWITLVMKGGSKREIMISNPIVEINGVFYKAMYAPADDLNNLYSKLDYKAVKK